MIELYIVNCTLIQHNFLIQIFILRWEWEPWSVRKATPVGCQVWPTAIRYTMDIQGKWIKSKKYVFVFTKISCSNSDQTAEFDDLISALRTGDVFGENMDKFKRNRKSRTSPPRVERMESFLRERSNERILAPWKTWDYFSDRAPVILGVGRFIIMAQDSGNWHNPWPGISRNHSIDNG